MTDRPPEYEVKSVFWSLETIFKGVKTDGAAKAHVK